ncbi:MAG: hypothetical protein JSV65_16330 [Armatimonadota bacterium]|nr:MAG: hypothetical protein JSV65_16330 [Armatimonadota bacterium]
MKKGISPVVTVVVILLVVLIVALAWYIFSTPRATPGDDTGISIEVTPKEEAGSVAREKAAEAKEELDDQRESSAEPVR